MSLEKVCVEVDLDLKSLSVRVEVPPDQCKAVLQRCFHGMVQTRRSARQDESRSMPAETSSLKRRQREPTQEAEEDDLPTPASQPESTISQREILAAEAARHRLYGRDAAQAAPTGRLPDGPAPSAVEIEYTPTELLTPCSSPAEDVQAALEQLDSKSWINACAGLNTLRQLARHHPQLCQPLLSGAVPLVLKSIRNPRSSLCKLAIMCVADLVLAMEDGMLAFLDVGGASQPASSVLSQLLLKASSNDKRFVVEEAIHTLDVISTHVSPIGLAERVLPYTNSKSPKQRGAAAGVLLACVRRMAASNLAAPACQPFLQAAGSLVTDNTQEARDASRNVIALVHDAFQANMASQPPPAPLSPSRKPACQDNTSENGVVGPEHLVKGPAKIPSNQSPGKGSRRHGDTSSWVQKGSSDGFSFGEDRDGPEGAIQALRVSQEGKENHMVLSSETRRQEAWADYCKGSLAPTVAAAVLKVSTS